MKAACHDCGKKITFPPEANGLPAALNKEHGLFYFSGEGWKACCKIKKEHFTWGDVVYCCNPKILPYYPRQI